MNYKLSEILQALETIEKTDNSDMSVISSRYLRDLSNTVKLINSFDLVDKDKASRELDRVFEKIQETTDAIDEILKLRNQFKKILDKEKKKSHQNLLKQVNNAEFTFEWPDDEDYLSHRNSWTIPDAVFYHIAELIGKHSNWKLPTVYLEPHNNKLIRHIIGGEPFYFVDDREIPYQKMLTNMPEESVNRVFHYKKATARDNLELNSAGLCVNWQNIPYKKLGEIKKDIDLMADLLAPGGIMFFDYVDANDSVTAKAIEDGKFTFQWRERILQFVDQNNLEIIYEGRFSAGQPVILFCKKPGELPDPNINNKIGLVLPDINVFDEKREKENQLRRFYKSITSSLQKDIETAEKRDRLLNELDQQRQIDTTKILENKLKAAVNRLDIVMSQYNSDHPAVLEALLQLSKLTHQLGRIKDSQNLLKRAKKNIENLNPNSDLYKNYHEWLDFLNNS